MANKAEVTNLVAVNLYERVFKSGSTGFFGRVVDPATGKQYQITAAVEIGTKPKAA
jgi:hypothetical protein